MEYAKFGQPILAEWLLQNILSLIDIPVVGTSAATSIAELSALEQGRVDSTSYLFCFMGVATASLFSVVARPRQQLG
ncbi:hypothetical protein EON64_16685 [archaeon]|nr:MAG: hypothetical protein EON64_16685 [archaeon]